MTIEATLTIQDIKALIQAKMKEYKKLSVFEQYAMFMGKAQILEFRLKGLLSTKYNVPFENMENLAEPKES